MKKTTTAKQYRQGDVMIERIEKLPTDFKAIPLDGGRIVLAHGEVTGHAHAFSPEHAEKFVAPEGDEFFKVTGERIVATLDIVRRWKSQVMVKHPELGLIEFAEQDLIIEGDRAKIRGRFGILTHDEHTAQAIPAGYYRGSSDSGTVRQREYSPEAIRNVQD